MANEGLYSLHFESEIKWILGVKRVIQSHLKTEYVTMVIDDFLQFISPYMIFAYHSCSFLSFSTSAVLFLV